MLADAVHDNCVESPDAVYPSIAQSKRVLEWWSSSAEFRDLIAVDTKRAMVEYKLDFDPEVIRPLWDGPFGQRQYEAGEPIHPAVQAYRDHYAEKTRWRDRIKEECAPDDPRFRAWRARQVARNTMENGFYDNHIIHAPVAIELTDGCSVGCWFCGVGATKVGASFPYTPANASLWRDVLRVLHDTIGAAARWGFLYWATDPLDNPDYERFAGDFADETGMFPQTTTAQGHKDPARILPLLAESAARGCKVNRFSVLNEPLLRKIYEAYTPEDLAGVEIVAQMRGSITPKADAGAFRLLAKNNRKVVSIEQSKLAELARNARRLAGDTSESDLAPAAQPTSIACVSGFLLNMVTRKIKLISPCRASDAWPLGYIVFEERSFTDARDLGQSMEAMIARHMPIEIEPHHAIRIHPNFTFHQAAGGFRITSPMNAVDFVRPDLEGYVTLIGDLVRSGDRTAGQIALSSLYQHGIPEPNTMSTLGAMFELGLLADVGSLAEARPAGLS